MLFRSRGILQEILIHVFAVFFGILLLAVIGLSSSDNQPEQSSKPKKKSRKQLRKEYHEALDRQIEEEIDEDMEEDDWDEEHGY